MTNYEVTSDDSLSEEEATFDEPVELFDEDGVSQEMLDDGLTRSQADDLAAEAPPLREGDE